MTRIGSAGTSDRNVLAYGSFNIWWRNITKKELSANLYCNRKICFVRVFSVGLLNDYVRGNQFRKVVHDQSGKDLLGNILHLFCVKMEQANRVLQRSKRGLDAPSSTIKVFQLFRRKSIRIQVCNHCLIRRIR